MSIIIVIRLKAVCAELFGATWASEVTESACAFRNNQWVCLAVRAALGWVEERRLLGNLAHEFSSNKSRYHYAYTSVSGTASPLLAHFLKRRAGRNERRRNIAAVAFFMYIFYAVGSSYLPLIVAARNLKR